jgi:hypothetical protein
MIHKTTMEDVGFALFLSTLNNYLYPKIRMKMQNIGGAKLSLRLAEKVNQGRD